MERIIVVDFGGQYSHLIANRVRRLGVLSEIFHPENIEDELNKGNVKGIIFSGGPSSVYESKSPKISEEILKKGIPVLGICYGLQIMTFLLKGEVKRAETKEYGITQITLSNNLLFEGLNNIETAWMSHGDLVITVPEGFEVIASSKDCPIAGMTNKEKKLYGVQFHPEVTHTPNGSKILKNFLFNICNCKKDWNTKNYLDEITQYIKEKSHNKKAFLLLSGGVDSVVLFTLLNKIIGIDNVLGVHVDTGLMRKNESEEVKKILNDFGMNNFVVIDAKEEFLKPLEKVIQPEEKRKIIGNKFVDIVENYSNKILTSNDWIIAQGTIYPDTIETQGTKNSELIKTHHNRVQKMQELINKGKVIEPLAHLYKDEVRELGKLLGLPEELTERHPFPGPGLAVRILCSEEEKKIEQNPELLKISKNSFILPLKSVGVQGDNRTYKHPAVITEQKEWEELEQISTTITNKIEEVNRVLLLLDKKSEELTMKKKSMSKERIELLQDIDYEVTKIIKKHELYNKIWQMPVVLAPIGGATGESIILRPVDSQEAMTASFSKINKNIIKEITKTILKDKRIDAVFYDITNKPPATIEWE